MNTFAWNRNIVSGSAAQTQQWGERIALRLQPGDLVTLRGELGAGKTTFTQGIARGLNLTESVTSPTFVLMLEYSGPVPLLHLDAYRLENMDEDELGDAGIWDLLERDDAIKLIEWPQRIEKWLPRPRLDVCIESHDENVRTLILSADQPFELEI